MTAGARGERYDAIVIGSACELTLSVRTDKTMIGEPLSLLAGTGVGTVFVDHQLCIQRFTPAVTRMINLIRSDIGRPLGHITTEREAKGAANG